MTLRAVMPALFLAVACAPESVESVTLTPETPEIEAVLRAADARWEAAGVAADRIIVGPGGAPVRFVPERDGTSTTEIHVRDRTFAGVEWIELDAMLPHVAAHELGHALGIGWPMLDDDHVHGEACDADAEPRPTMCVRGGSVITAADLELACSVGPCVGFAPEVSL